MKHIKNFYMRPNQSNLTYESTFFTWCATCKSKLCFIKIPLELRSSEDAVRYKRFHFTTSKKILIKTINQS